ncbi:MAG: nitroreductase family protein, partial [Clostridia bacterium]|nr:nitroreductase family protein [Clostridia bacterium]
MNTFENLFSRRSIRTYNGENVTEAELAQILKAAYAAPVGRALFDT